VTRHSRRAGFEQGTQFRRDHGRSPEPQREATHGVVQQHAEFVGGAQIARRGA
jgi:hypothetical protein